MNQWQFHDMTFTWLTSNYGYIDGGTVFGVVPKEVWQKRYPSTKEGKLKIFFDPILLQYKGKNYLIDTGVHTSKFDKKMFLHTNIKQETKLEKSLHHVALKPEDIDVILMTHMHNDHASGLTKLKCGNYCSVFPKAKIIVSKTEWNEVTHPNRRTKNTYRKENWEAIQHQIYLFEKQIEIAPGIEMIVVGGHSKGLSILRFTQQKEVALHVSDLLHTTIATNPLWVTAFDDYPMDSIAAKERWVEQEIQNGSYFLFYHDAYYLLAQYHKDGKTMKYAIKREKS